MKKFKYSVLLVMVLAFALFVVGCAKPPEAEQQAAKVSMDAAAAAGADKYAIADLTAAKKIWDAAEAQVKDKKYKEAKQGYVDAKAAFEKATAAVAAGKKAVADEVTTALMAVEESGKGLEATAQKLDKKLLDKKDVWLSEATVFGDTLKTAKEMIAADPMGAKAKVDELKAFIDKWDAAFKEIAAIPDKPEPKKATKKVKS
jgi:PBP1b-binding outer membrane lipoprotein LpoB